MEDIELIQPAGIGDIIFIQKLCHDLTQDGFNVWLNVHKVCWDNGISKLSSSANIGLFSASVSSPMPKNIKRIDLSDQPKPNGYIDTMVSKYEGLGFSWVGWQKFFSFRRDIEAEKECFDILNVNKNEPFILINKNFGTPPGNKEKQGVGQLVPDNYDGKVIEMKPGILPLYAWLGVIESAEEIHCVDSSINYFCEILSLKAKRLLVYPRFPAGKATVEMLFDAPWEWQS